MIVYCFVLFGLISYCFVRFFFVCFFFLGGGIIKGSYSIGLDVLYSFAGIAFHARYLTNLVNPISPGFFVLVSEPGAGGHKMPPP